MLDNDQSKVILCFGIFLLLASALMYFISRLTINKINSVKNWLTVRAVVTEILWERQIGGRPGVDNGSYTPGYEYEIKGQKYTGTGSIKSSISEYDKGDSIIVRVNPDNHADNYCMDEKNSIFGYGMMFCSVVVFGMGSVIIVLLFMGLFK